MKVFVGGSKNIGVLPERALRKIDEYVDGDGHILVGDCHGVDLAVQKHLSERGAKNVTVYCSGQKPRFNVGGWSVVALGNAELSGYAFYALKDARMVRDADCGLMVWNGATRGTARNIQELKKLNKPVEIIAYEND